MYLKFGSATVNIHMALLVSSASMVISTSQFQPHLLSMQHQPNPPIFDNPVLFSDNTHKNTPKIPKSDLSVL